MRRRSINIEHRRTTSSLDTRFRISWILTIALWSACGTTYINSITIMFWVQWLSSTSTLRLCTWDWVRNWHEGRWYRMGSIPAVPCKWPWVDTWQYTVIDTPFYRVGWLLMLKMILVLYLSPMSNSSKQQQVATRTDIHTQHARPQRFRVILGLAPATQQQPFILYMQLTFLFFIPNSSSSSTHKFSSYFIHHQYTSFFSLATRM